MKRRLPSVWVVLAALTVAAIAVLHQPARRGPLTLVIVGHGSASASASAFCTASALSLHASDRVTVPGGVGESFAVTNTGSAACRLDGVPRLAVTDTRGHTLYVPRQLSAGQSAPVVLAAHRAADFWVDFLAPGGARITGAAELAVTLPEVRGALRVALPPAAQSRRQVVISAIQDHVTPAAPALVA